MANSVKIKGKFLLILRDSQEFKQLLADDFILDELEKSRNKQNDKLELAAVRGGGIGIGKIANSNLPCLVVEPVTPAILSYLWEIESPFLGFSDGKVLSKDVDIALYILDNGKDLYTNKDLNISKIAVDSLDYTPKNGLNYETARDAIHGILQLGFSAYKMFPDIPTIDTQSKNITRYDADWITGIVSMVHAVTGLTPTEILWNTAMTSCGFYIAHYCRKNGMKNIGKRTDMETVKLMMERTNDLCKEFLLKQGYKEEEFLQ